MARPRAISQVLPCTNSGGKRPPVALFIARSRLVAASMPSPLPSKSIPTASVSTSTVTRLSEKPMVLRIASSGMRSRSDWAMVLPVKSRRVKNTAARMRMTSAPISPICLAKAIANAFSGWVLVSSGEFRNSASIAAEMALACVASVMRSMYQPVRPLLDWRASSKCVLH